MTRETKIGLLVGLGFIILFGLILGDRRPEAADADGTRVSVATRDIGELGPDPLEAVRRERQRNASSPPIPPDSRGGLPLLVPPPPEPDIARQDPVPQEPIVEPVPLEPRGNPQERPGHGIDLDDLRNAFRGGQPIREPIDSSAGANGAADRAAPAPSDRYHVVEEGETLSRISRRYFTTDRYYREIYEANRDVLPDVNSVRAGMRLRIPTLGGQAAVTPGGSATAGGTTPAAGTSYTVVQGDTLIGISRKVYGSDRHHQRILDANRATLPDARSLRPGQTLTIPSLPAAPPPVPAANPAGGTRSGAAVAGNADSGHRTVSYENLRETVARTYRVESGDTLSRIARRELNDDSEAAVRKLFEANRDVLESPNQLRVGVVLTVPR